jgi:tRNA threonylcarbamoyladenosine biosynthesis protein TsaB
MNVLALDTSTEVLALCAARIGGSAPAASVPAGPAPAASRGVDEWASLCLRRGLQHSPALLPLAEQLLARVGLGPAGLELLVCSLGPGSFTGIRIGLATALGISQGRGIPVVGVSTLEAIARTWEGHDGDLFPVLDARKGRIYTARFRGGARQGEYHDCTPGELTAMLDGAERPLLAGPDAERIRAMLGPAEARLPCGVSLDPLSLLRIGVERYTKEGADPGPLKPLYLRKSEAEIASGV